MAVKNLSLKFGREIVKQPDGSNKIRKIYSKKPAIQFAREYFGDKPIKAIEIGVWKGEGTKEILDVLSVDKMYAIDMWKPFGSSEHDTETMKMAEDATRKKLSKYPQVEILKMSSDKAVRLLPKGMDFIYIDGNHDYEYVKKDIENYYPLLKQGGILAGDDIANRRIPNGVFKALAEFSVKHKLDVTIEGAEWWVVKK